MQYFFTCSKSDTTVQETSHRQIQHQQVAHVKVTALDLMSTSLIVHVKSKAMTYTSVRTVLRVSFHCEINRQKEMCCVKKKCNVIHLQCLYRNE